MVEGKTTASDPTAAVRAGFDRIASVYDLVEAPLELCARSWRRAQWATVGAERVLDVGVGTGKSIASYPAGAHVTAIDVSPRMLARAARRPIPRRARPDLLLADVQRLPFEDETFDVAVTTFVFCSVPDPLQGLREIRRVLKPAGRLSMVEHVLSTKWWLRPPMQVLDPVVAAGCGEHIARDTLRLVRTAGFENLASRDLMLDVVKSIDGRR